MQQKQRGSIYNEKRVAFSARKGRKEVKKGEKRGDKVKKIAWRKSLRGSFLRLSATMDCIYYEKDLANSFGDWTTWLAGTKEIPNAEAKASE